MRWLFWVLGGINALAAFAIGVSRQNWPSSSLWTGYPKWLLFAVVKATVPLIQLGVNECREREERRGFQRTGAT